MENVSLSFLLKVDPHFRQKMGIPASMGSEIQASRRPFMPLLNKRYARVNFAAMKEQGKVGLDRSGLGAGWLAQSEVKTMIY